MFINPIPKSMGLNINPKVFMALDSHPASSMSLSTPRDQPDMADPLRVRSHSVKP